MKQEQANTFSEGINYDMTPLIMNNRVLSDCVNGTLVTFNGDELALQNDSGNTTIKYNIGTKKDPIWTAVSLSPGYYPIGIKEYGGVLYIVSACNPNTIEEWSVEKDRYYPLYLVKVKNGVGWDYYRCLSTPETNISPNLDPTHWVKESNLERIEIGSFPSPERPTMANGGDSPILLNIYNDKEVLHKSAVINNGEFRAGNYITFSLKNQGELDLSNMSYYSYASEVDFTYNIKTYKIRLLQQLTNGFIDLTDSVWDQYASYKDYTINSEDEPTSFWFTDPDFKFYCPNNYKGKLAIIVELEPLKMFKLISCTINFENGIYNFDFEIKLQNESEVDIKWALLNSWIDDSNNTKLTPILIPFDNGVAKTTLQLQLEDTEIKRRLNYEITPVICSTETNFITNCRGLYVNNENIQGNTFFSNWTHISSNITLTEDDTLKSKSKFVWTGTSSLSGMTHLWPIPVSDDSFVLSFKIKGPNGGVFNYGLESDLKSITTNGTWKEVSLLINSSGLNTTDILTFNSTSAGTFELGDIKLELGTISSGWSESIDSIHYLDTDLPSEYLIDNKYILTGSKLIASAYDDVLLERDKTSEGFRCDIAYDGTAYTKIFILKNNKGDYLTPQLDVSESKYYFREYTDGNLTLPSDCIGEYKIIGTTAKDSKIKLERWNESLSISLQDYLQNLLESQSATYNTDLCNLLQLNINLSKKLDSFGKVSVVWGEGTDPIVMTKTTDTMYTAWIKPYTSFTLKVEYGNGDTYHNEAFVISNGISTNTTWNYAIITKFSMYKHIVSQNPETYNLYLYTYLPIEMQLPGIRSFKYIISPETDWAYGTFQGHTTNLPIDIVGYLSERLTDQPISLEEYTYSLNFDLPEHLPITENYVNILDKSQYKLIGTENPEDGYEIIKVQENN